MIAATMRQLSKNDALFLASESAHSNSNVSLVRSTTRRRRPAAGCASRASSRSCESRLHRSPIFRQKLLQRAVRARRAVLDRGRELRPRVPRAPHRAAEAGRLAPVLHPGLAHPRAPARPATGRCGRSTSSRASTASSTCRRTASRCSPSCTTRRSTSSAAPRSSRCCTTRRRSRRRPSRPSRGSRESPPSALELVCRGVVHTATSPLRLARPLRERARARRRRAARSFASELLQRQDAAAGDALQLHRVAATGCSRRGASCSTSSARSAGSCPARRSTTPCSRCARARCAGTSRPTTSCRNGTCRR